MKLIKPSFEIIEQQPELQGIYEQIELAGRTCYKSDPKYSYMIIHETPDGGTMSVQIDKALDEPNSIKFAEEQYLLGNKRFTRFSMTAKEFVDRMIKSGHGAMLEHGTVYLKLSYTSPVDDIKYLSTVGTHMKYAKNKYSKVISLDDGHFKTDVFITTNFRVIAENNWLDDLQYICEPTECHEKRITVKFNTQIAITREANRHRVDSIAESSTRYCNYNKDKFGNEISINVPTFIDESKIDLEYPSFRGLCHCIYDKEDDVIFSDITYWIFANLACEYSYMNLIRLGWKAEQARTVLPLDTNSELIHTAFVSDWEHFFDLRCDKSAHQDIRALAIPLKDEFVKRNLI